MAERTFDRVGRKEQASSLLRSENRVLTAYQLAKLMGVKPSWYWRNLFVEMVRERMIEGCIGKKANGKDVFLFWVNGAPLDCLDFPF